MTPRSFRHARESIEQLCEQVLPYDQFIDKLLSLLRRAVPFDRSAVLMVDPETVLPVGGMVLNIPTIKCDPFWENEYAEEDLNKFSTLTAGRTVVRSTRIASGGNPRRSVRFRTLYDDLEVGDELRAAFTSTGACWGIATFLRNAEHGPFTSTEQSFVLDLAPYVAAGLRRTVLAETGDLIATGPGMMVFDTTGQIEMMTPEAAQWLDELELRAGGETFSPATLILTEVAARARQLAKGEGSTPARMRARTRTGRWLTVHASSLEDKGRPTDRVGVVIEPAKGGDLASLLVEAYDLTRREREVLELLSYGHSTKEIAVALNISVHTARDYVKIIFDKVKVRSRGELIARIFWQHARDKLEANMKHSTLS